MPLNLVLPIKNGYTLLAAASSDKAVKKKHGLLWSLI